MNSTREDQQRVARNTRRGHQSDQRQRGEKERDNEHRDLRITVAEKAAADAADRPHPELERGDRAGHHDRQADLAFVQIGREAVGRPEHLVAAEHDGCDQPQFGNLRERLQIGQHVVALSRGAIRGSRAAALRILHEREHDAERDAQERVHVDHQSEAGRDRLAFASASPMRTA